MSGWVLIRSWHRISTATRVPDSYVTLCGRRIVHGALSDTLPAGKSCETCLRILAREDDRTDADQ